MLTAFCRYFVRPRKLVSGTLLRILTAVSILQGDLTAPSRPHRSRPSLEAALYRREVLAREDARAPSQGTPVLRAPDRTLFQDIRRYSPSRTSAVAWAVTEGIGAAVRLPRGQIEAGAFRRRGRPLQSTTRKVSRARARAPSASTAPRTSTSKTARPTARPRSGDHQLPGGAVSALGAAADGRFHRRSAGAR